ncbi:MAG: hypothetical protein OIF56_05365 [Cohaesibacter sp.]|nr:hypothetical protein [Cohaesibacter sp.]
MMSILAFFTGSKAGRWLALALLIMASLSLFAVRMFSRGRQAEQAKQTQQALTRLRTRIETDEAISRLPADERRKRLSDDWAN